MDKEKAKLNVILSQTDKIKMNYEELKNYLHYEDIFFDNIIKPIANKNDLSISFSGKYIIFKKKVHKEENCK